MPELTREDLYSALQPLQADLGAVKNELAGVKGELAAVKNDLAAVKNDIAMMKTQMAGVRIRLDGLPLIGTAIEALQPDSRQLRAAINDRVMARQAELETRLTELERNAPKR